MNTHPNQNQRPACLPCWRRPATLTRLHPKQLETVQLNQEKSVRIIWELTQQKGIRTGRFPPSALCCLCPGDLPTAPG